MENVKEKKQINAFRCNHKYRLLQVNLCQYKPVFILFRQRLSEDA